MMSALSDLLDIARDVAPSVAGAAATVVSGGNPAVGALVTSVLGGILGKDGPTTKEDLEDMAGAILADPEKIQAFRLEMRKLELKELEIRTLDVKSARDTLSKSKGAVVLSTIVVTAFAVSVILVMTTAIPEGSQNLAYLLLGTLAAAFGGVLNFWLGSSVGSKDKTDILAAYAAAATSDQAARLKRG